VRLRFFQRLDEADRTEEAEDWLRRDIEAGDTSSLWLLASRLDQSGQAEEANELRQRTRDAVPGATPNGGEVSIPLLAAGDAW
jgi:hypothetical protein